MMPAVVYLRCDGSSVAVQVNESKPQGWTQHGCRGPRSRLSRLFLASDDDAVAAGIEAELIGERPDDARLDNDTFFDWLAVRRRGDVKNDGHGAPSRFRLAGDRLGRLELDVLHVQSSRWTVPTVACDASGKQTSDYRDCNRSNARPAIFQLMSVAAAGGEPLLGFRRNIISQIRCKFQAS